MIDIVEIFKEYNGTGYFCLLFIAALIYLYFTEENKSLRMMLVIVPTVLQVLFFIPYFYFAYNMLDEGTYYRILWLLPMTLVIAYSAVKVIGTHLRLGVALICVLFALCGSYTYIGSVFTVAENPYHIPDEVIQICDMIKPEDKDTRIWAAFPPSLVHFVRQYTTNIMLPFGRDSMVDTWKKADNELFDLYMSPVIPADRLVKSATDYQCDYVIISREEVIDGDVTDYGLKEVGATDNYVVYSNLENAVWYDVGLENYNSALYRDSDEDK